MGLLVGDHLDTVLDGAERPVGGGEVVAGRGIDPAALREPGEGVDRPPAAERRVAAAGDKLLGLDEELDLADAAAAELDVVAGDGDLGMAAEVVDLPLDRMDVGDGGVVEIFPPDIGDELGEEGLARSDIAGDRPRLDEGGALPVLAEALVVLERGLGRQRDVGGAGVGPSSVRSWRMWTRRRVKRTKSLAMALSSATFATAGS
jgi:hypothetical protein